jgi:6-phosphogluconate dehydrogenase (decarboxylating)
VVNDTRATGGGLRTELRPQVASGGLGHGRDRRGVPAHVLSSALYERVSSRGAAEFANRLLSAMRYEFGGHIEKRP